MLSCYHPMLAYKKYDHDTGKYKVVILKKDASLSDEDFIRQQGELFLNSEYGEKVIQLPCGKCNGCRIDYSKNWATRCVLESTLYERNYFVTLTYDDEHLLSRCYRQNVEVDHVTGEVTDQFDSVSLNPDDLHRFMHDLRQLFDRKYGEQGIRFFACGEYGSKSKRPHFHLLLFNCNLRDLNLYKVSRGNSLFNSEDISKCWPYGFSVVGDLTYESCAYVARYMLKKVKGDPLYYERNGLIPEFVRMSRKPGIAKSYYDANSKKIYASDQIVIKTSKGAKEVKPPKYFDKMYEADCPEDFERIKDVRVRKGESFEKSVMSKTNVGSRKLYLYAREADLADKLTRLPRSLC